MKKTKLLSLELNKKVIEQLDRKAMLSIKGGEEFLSIWGSNCNNSDPNAHQCCAGAGSESGACVSGTGNATQMCQN